MPEKLYSVTVEADERVVLVRQGCQLGLETPIVIGTTGEKVRLGGFSNGRHYQRFSASFLFLHVACATFLSTHWNSEFANLTCCDGVVNFSSPSIPSCSSTCGRDWTESSWGRLCRLCWTRASGALRLSSCTLTRVSPYQDSTSGLVYHLCG